ncbi:hypothetical protein PHYBLDRAFT_71524 [Phycomyces blakesleeanus NRRL 1555(-)]|uniref:DDE-1 domain-containing protein n=1 Tax=Phycomyces blakesleeanus (strain ATCC 8743b / DSM 1359 / FGSC 10004 / NBRC 33097 / NRRL 1555) TaxID=763407 RepID=A0A167LBT1_PHYB8|nr:hypothetical protein PHYBLDRAFT_71524 [Phycomyces blakesleeanus NRRL 1555(-)]OAD70085.1 hypothetical protein PHYBLDRAFT_71524 [Phycomyces blakesleeanus NRRL 1555(-)]|eukprot:XP_018288125.1 hypothetical protein PHYBLDRAFT_71524 [Phycomyces blakesleeanus NRRL 1555(-)]
MDLPLSHCLKHRPYTQLIIFFQKHYPSFSTRILNATNSLSHTLVENTISETSQEELFDAETESENEKIQLSYENLCEYIKQQISFPSDRCISVYEIMKHQAVKTYFFNRIQDFRKMEALIQAMENVYNQTNTYLSLAIRKWGKEYIVTRYISRRQQGKFIRPPFILADEAIANATSNWICQQKIEKRTASNVKRYIDQILYPVKFGVVGDISLFSINKYMKTWGFSFRKSTSTVYVNGHKREDVVKRMEEYSGDNKEVVEEPKVLHRRDGYWTSDNIIKQLTKDVISLFELLHPDSQAVFIFDQSSNHQAFANNVLLAKRFTLNNKPVKEDKEFDFKNTTFLLDGEPCPQAMYYMKMETITKKKRSVDIAVKYVKEIRNEEPDSKCCAHHFLAVQPNFKKQKIIICEVVKANDHIFEMYPKFHCECNWIERYCGPAKDLVRKKSDYNFKSLKINVNSYLDRAVIFILKLTSARKKIPDRDLTYLSELTSWIEILKSGIQLVIPFNICPQCYTDWFPFLLIKTYYIAFHKCKTNMS